MTKIKLSQKGFTLIEIIVVLSVISFLASIVIPSIIQARATARRKTCVSNLRMIRDAKTIYYNVDNGTKDPLALSDLVPTYVKNTPACPSGGTYDVRGGAQDPLCSYGDGHAV